jgi:DNA-directed RNA polymerase subunit alpha
LKGVQEDVINLILNLKQIRLKLFSPGPEVLTLHVKKSGVVKAKDIAGNSNVEILTPEQIIAHLDASADLDVEIEVNRGRGFVPAERLKREGQPINTIFVDALFSPVKKVHYGVENARVGQMTDYDKLILEVWTDGSISPVDAVAHAAGILRESISTFLPVEAPRETVAVADPASPVASDIRERLKDLVDQPVDIIELSVRPSNCLKAAKIRTLGELLSKTEEELLGYKNFGQKSLDEIREKLKEMNLDLGILATAGSKGAS